MALFQRPTPRDPKKTLRRIWIFFGVTVVLLLFAASMVALYLSARLNQQTLSKKPDYTSSQLYSQALAQADNGDYKSAQTYLQQALSQQDDATFRNQLAIVDYQLKQYNDSIVEYKKLIAGGTDVAFAWNGIGNDYRDWALQDASQKKNYEDLAETAYRNSIALDPQAVATYSNLALMLNDEGRKSDALAVLDEGFATTKQSVLQDIRKNIAQ